MAPVRVSAAALTHVGAVRAANEDTIAFADWIESGSMAGLRLVEQTVSDTPLVALVADGMGGHAAGEVASRSAAEYLSAQAARADDDEAVARLVDEANAELFTLMEERPALTGMGTTAAGVAITPSRAIAFNVGDSRVYRVFGDGLVQLSTDDTPGPKLPDGRTAMYTSNVITQTLGGAGRRTDVEPHVLGEPLEDGARYLIASDGLTDLLEPSALAQLVGADDGASVEAMFGAAMEQGGRDNISIILLRITFGGN
jgi:serine/threonine protein phosphatase PrpC